MNYTKIPLLFFLIIAVFCDVLESTSPHLHSFTGSTEENNKLISNTKVASESEEDEETWEIRTNQRRESVKNAFVHTWAGYLQHAFGDDELRPISKSGSNTWGNLGVTLIDALDTMFIMGLKDEFNYSQTRAFVENLDFSQRDVSVNLFETTIRILGGLLAAYDQTRDDLYKEKAKQLGDILLHAFNTTTGIPHRDINLKTKECSSPPYLGGGVVLSEFGGIQLEFRYLSHILNDPVYFEKMLKIQEAMEQIQPQSGLFPVNIHPFTGLFTTDHITFGAYGDSFYEYLLKQWIQTNRTEERYRIMYESAMDGMIKHLVKKTFRSQLAYIGQLKSQSFLPQMDHLVCFVPGMLGLGHSVLHNESHLQLAKELMHTCYQMYVRNPTGLGPEIARFDVGYGDFRNFASHYILRPETVESLFVLYRITGDVKYQDWGWNIFNNLVKHCKTEVGFSGIKDVGSVSTAKDDAMQSFFLSETLKYLYLLFSPTDFVPLDKYVFTTEGHPLSIWTGSEA